MLFLEQAYLLGRYKNRERTCDADKACRCNYTAGLPDKVPVVWRLFFRSWWVVDFKGSGVEFVDLLLAFVCCVGNACHGSVPIPGETLPQTLPLGKRVQSGCAFSKFQRHLVPL